MYADERISKEEFANRMRRSPTDCEKKLYTTLLSVFSPYKATIQMQIPVGPYIADICIMPKMLIVEIDGDTHRTEEAKKYDERRDGLIKRKGFSIMRVSNKDVYENAWGVSNKILSRCLPLDSSGNISGVTKLPPSRYTPSRRVIPMTWRKINQRGY